MAEKLPKSGIRHIPMIQEAESNELDEPKETHITTQYSQTPENSKDMRGEKDLESSEKEMIPYLQGKKQFE